MSSNIESGNFGGAISPAQIIADVLQHSEDIQCVVVVSLTKDDKIKTCWSDGSSLMRIGMLETAKDDIRETMSEDDDSID